MQRRSPQDRHSLLVSLPAFVFTNPGPETDSEGETRPDCQLRWRRDGRPLRGTTIPSRQSSVLALYRCCQPPLHIQPDPFQVGIRLHRLDDKVMGNFVEEPGDVTIQHPRVRETTCPAGLHRVQRGPSRPVTIRAGMELGFHHLLQLHGHHRLGHPVRDRRHPEHPDPITVQFRHRDGFHRRRKVAARGHPIPRHIQSVPQIGLELLDRAPIHPRPALVRPHFPERLYHRLLGDRKRLPTTLAGSPSASWPFDQLTQRAIPDEPSPWLHAHYRRFITTTRRSASDRGYGTQLLTVSAARSTPSRPRRIHHGDHVRARLPTFPAKAAGEGHAASVPDTAWPIDGHPPDSSQIHSNNLVLMSLLYSRHVNSGRLPRPHLTHHVRLFHIAHHDGLQPTQHVAV